MPVRVRFGRGQTLRIGIQMPTGKTQADNGYRVTDTGAPAPYKFISTRAFNSCTFSTTSWRLSDLYFSGSKALLVHSSTAA